MSSLLEELSSLVSAFDESGIEYAVCGGLSVAIHGYSRATLDIDLLIQGDQLGKALALGVRQGYDIRGADLSFRDGAIEIRRVSKIDSEGELLSLDLILVTPEISEVWETRQTVDIKGTSVCVVSREGLLAMKRLAGRPQDLADIHNLEYGES